MRSNQLILNNKISNLDWARTLRRILTRRTFKTTICDKTVGFDETILKQARFFVYRMANTGLWTYQIFSINAAVNIFA